MSRLRESILTIGGFDPSGGAGVLADVKTFEQHKLTGLSVLTCNTVQSENQFLSIHPIEKEIVLNQLELMLKSYTIKWCKIGLINDIDLLRETVRILKKNDVRILLDPILKASAGFDFDRDITSLLSIIDEVDWLMPNANEILTISGLSNVQEASEMMSQRCNVYLKGGHLDADLGKDYVYMDGSMAFSLNPMTKRASEKHGSGCILAAALVANLTKGYTIKNACVRSKDYVSKCLDSNLTKLSFHKR